MSWVRCLGTSSFFHQKPYSLSKFFGIKKACISSPQGKCYPEKYIPRGGKRLSRTCALFDFPEQNTQHQPDRSLDKRRIFLLDKQKQLNKREVCVAGWLLGRRRKWKSPSISAKLHPSTRKPPPKNSFFKRGWWVYGEIRLGIFQRVIRCL